MAMDPIMIYPSIKCAFLQTSALYKQKFYFLY
jgi:hypothetical protein